MNKCLGRGNIEAVCKVCGAHLVHVFPDGPPPSGLRFYIGALSRESDKSTGAH